MIEVCDEIEGIERRYQLVTNLVAPLRFIVREPVASLQSGKAPPTAKLTASLENQSDSEKLVHLEVTAAPEGWQADLVGQPIRLLTAKGRTTVRVNARRWTGVKERRKPDLLAFSLRPSPSVAAKSRPKSRSTHVRRPPARPRAVLEPWPGTLSAGEPGSPERTSGVAVEYVERDTPPPHQASAARRICR